MEKKKPSKVQSMYEEQILGFRYKVITYFSLFLAFAITLRDLTVIYLGKEQSVIGLIVAALILLNTVVFHYMRNLVITASILLLILGIWMLAVLTTGVDNGQGLYWFYTFPILAYLTTGRRMAIVWMSLIITAILGALWLGSKEIIPFAYETDVVGYFILSVVSTFALVYIYETINQRYLEVLEYRRKELADTSINLEREFEQRQDMQNRLESLLHAITEGIIATDKKGIITHVNEAAEHMLHTHDEDLVGKRLKNVLPIFDADRHPLRSNEYPLDKVLNLGHSITTNLMTGKVLQYRLLDDETKMFPVSLSIGPIKDHDGKIVGSIQAFRDITNEYEINKAKSEFIYQASHQLKTPLTSINWYVESLRTKDKSKLKKWQLEYLDEVYESSQRLTELVNDLLEISRIEMKQNYKDQQVLVAAEIQKIIKGISGLMKERKVKVTFTDLPTKQPMRVHFNRHFFGVVVENLISNAVRYSDAGSTVKVAITSVQVGGEFMNEEVGKRGVIISVADAGIGIPEEQQSRIFNKLFRASNAIDKEETGTGLGLYIAKSMVERHAGKIGFTSKVGEGTTFYVYLPTVSAS